MMTESERMSVTRREAVKAAAAGAVAAGLGVMASKEAAAQEAFDAIVIGTGFGGAVATIALSAHGKKTLVIEPRPPCSISWSLYPSPRIRRSRLILGASL